MPDRRRPGLWKTLVAAAQTAFDRLADGLEVAAEGLRSLGGDRTPAPPNDPRLAGVDPGIAAYVAAQDPQWFSFDLSGDAAGPDWPTGEGVLPQWPTGEAADAVPTPEAQDPAVARHPPSASSRPAWRRSRPARGEPTAAELPGGRPVRPSRISFHRPSREAPGRHASDLPASDLSASSPSGPDPSVPERDAAGDAGRPTSAESSPMGVHAGDSKVTRTRATADVAESGPATAVDRPLRETADDHLDDRGQGRSPQEGRTPRPEHIEPGQPSAGPWPGWSPSSSPALAFRSRGVGDSSAADRTATVGAPAPAQQQRDKAWPPPPAAVAPSRDRVEAVTRSRPADPAAIVPSVQLSRGDRSVPAAWPELPPSTWSAPPAESAGALAWESAAPADVLVDEQRST